MENEELILTGNLNCDLEKSTTDQQTYKLLTLSSLYPLTEIIREPTRITETTSFHVDLILAYISSAGVLHLGIFDHSLVYAVGKFELPKARPIIMEIRDLKHFSDTLFQTDLYLGIRYRPVVEGGRGGQCPHAIRT